MVAGYTLRSSRYRSLQNCLCYGIVPIIMAVEAKIAFIKPYLETDATWEMIRTSCYLGIWSIASRLKQRGHSVWYLDEVIRNNGMGRTMLYKTELEGIQYTESRLDMTIDDYRKEKNSYFELHSPQEFVEKYSAFQNGKIIRTIAKTGNSIEETLNELGRISPDYVGISLIATANVRAAIKTGLSIRKEFPNIKIIFGGHHVSALPEDFVHENPWVDHVVVGDGIDIFEKIVEGNAKDKILRPGFKTMDEFSLLDMDIISGTGYPLDQEYSYPSDGRKSTDFMFSKGCFRNCEFCVAGGQEGNHVSFMDWDKVDEQFRIFKNAGIEEIIVQDDAFIYGGKEALKRKMDLLKKYDFHWQDSGGIDFELLDDDITEQFIAFNKSGKGRFTGMYIPFNPRSWNKGLSATETMVQRYANNYRNLRRLREEGNIYVFTSEIVGTPEHTQQQIQEDIESHKQMIQEGYLDTALTLSATLLPGTAWYAKHKDAIVNVNDIPGYSLFTTHHRTENLPNPQMIEELFILRTKELNSIQSTYNWQTPFPNSVWVYRNP